MTDRIFQANLKKLMSTSVPFILCPKLSLCSHNVFSASPDIEQLHCKFRSADFFIHITCEPCIQKSFSASTSHKLMAEIYNSSFLILHIHFRNVGKETVILLQAGNLSLPQPPSKAVMTTNFCLFI